MRALGRGEAGRRWTRIAGAGMDKSAFERGMGGMVRGADSRD